MTFGQQPPYGQQTPYSPQPSEPDWNAMADRHAVDGRVRRMRWVTAIAVVGALAVGGAVGWVVGGGGKSGSDTAATKPGGTPSTSASAGALANRQLADSAGGAGGAALGVGLAASVQPAQGDPGFVGHPGLTDHALWAVGDPASYAATSGQVIDTTHSFTVSAWVLNRAKSDSRSAVSQGDGGYFGFDLGRDFWPKHNKWVFKVQTAAGEQNGTVRAVYSKADAIDVGQWVLLAGSYDAQAHTISLWVNGQLQGTTPVPGIFAEPGPLQLGRLTFQNRWADHWYGPIAKVQVWNAALTPTAAATTPPAHAWLTN